MDNTTNQEFIHPKYDKLETITMLLPNIDDNSTFSKHSRSSQSLVTPEEENPRKKSTTLVDEKTKSEELKKKPKRKFLGKHKGG